jgi:hypothetical protein
MGQPKLTAVPAAEEAQVRGAVAQQREPQVPLPKAQRLRSAELL